MKRFLYIDELRVNRRAKGNTALGNEYYQTAFNKPDHHHFIKYILTLNNFYLYFHY